MKHVATRNVDGTTLLKSDATAPSGSGDDLKTGIGRCTVRDTVYEFKRGEHVVICPPITRRQRSERFEPLSI